MARPSPTLPSHPRLYGPANDTLPVSASDRRLCHRRVHCYPPLGLRGKYEGTIISWSTISWSSRTAAWPSTGVRHELVLGLVTLCLAPIRGWGAQFADRMALGIISEWDTPSIQSGGARSLGS
ncbi:hypothetical protein K440DRAFT_635424 [Wilcoxina mikolae CBS 423.85]|nr:hypothetical protein K440DRAFT_635424 [Wilcoxina mikolae CBS 423.85]